MNKDLLFEIITPLNVTVRSTTDYWNYITSIKHRNLKGQENNVVSTLSQPDFIRKSKIDKSVFLYYKKVANSLFCAVVRHEIATGFLITAYITDRPKEGELIWTK